MNIRQYLYCANDSMRSRMTEEIKAFFDKCDENSSKNICWSFAGGENLCQEK